LGASEKQSQKQCTKNNGYFPSEDEREKSRKQLPEEVEVSSDIEPIELIMETPYSLTRTFPCCVGCEFAKNKRRHSLKLKTVRDKRV